MASEDPVQPPETTQPAKPEKAPVELYRIHSLVRATETRLQRMQAAVHHRFVQRFGGGSITVRRARAATVTRVLLDRHLAEIKKAVAEGKVVVKTMTGEVVDLDTFKVVSPAQVSAPLPHPPLDSAAKDVTFPHGVGQKIEQFEGGGAEGDNPPLNIQQPFTSDDQAISVAGDPAKVRASRADDEERDLEELLGDDEPTQPDALHTSEKSSSKKHKKHEKGGSK
jgi:hypothetical protein